MRVSVVSTLYQSAPYVAEFCRRASEAALEARKLNPRVKVIDLCEFIWP